MFQTTITIKRGKDATIIDKEVPVKVDALSPQVAADNGGRSPYDSFKLYRREGIPDIQRSDHITDEQSGIVYGGKSGDAV